MVVRIGRVPLSVWVTRIVAVAAAGFQSRTVIRSRPAARRDGHFFFAKPQHGPLVHVEIRKNQVRVTMVTCLVGLDEVAGVDEPALMRR